MIHLPTLPDQSVSGSIRSTVPPDQNSEANPLPHIDELLAAVTEEVVSNEGKSYVMILGLTAKCVKAEQLIAKQAARLAWLENELQTAVNEAVAERDGRIEKLEGMLKSVRELLSAPLVATKMPGSGQRTA